MSGGLLVRSMALLVKNSDPLSGLKISPPALAFESWPLVVAEASVVVPVSRFVTKTLLIGG